jgi:imidazoleglycerol-phosphate dehydratase
MGRSSSIERKTSETYVKAALDLDGEIETLIQTGIPFMDHMLNLMANHGLMGLVIQAEGDLEVDHHHTLEDVGICLGQIFKQALGDYKGIRRFGQALVPMDEALSLVAVDISNRPYLTYNVSFVQEVLPDFDVQGIKEFLRAFSQHAGFTLHINLLYGENTHHILEAVFKGLGKALCDAATLDPRVKGIPTTKGVF